MKDLNKLEEKYRELGKEIEELKSKKELPKTWEELGTINGWYINEHSITHLGFFDTVDSAKNAFPTRKEAESSLAWSQLLQLRDRYNGEPIDDWCDWSDGDSKYVIQRNGDKLEIYRWTNMYYPLVFKTEELRDEFLKNFEDLIKTAFCI